MVGVLQNLGRAVAGSMCSAVSRSAAMARGLVVQPSWMRRASRAIVRPDAVALLQVLVGDDALELGSAGSRAPG